MKSHLWYYSVTMLILIGVVLICAVGALAGGLGATRLDNWCARQLTDTDGQPE